MRREAIRVPGGGGVIGAWVGVLLAASSFTIALLYSWLGLAYASSLILVSGLLGLDVNGLVAAILLSQVAAAAAGTLQAGRARGGRVPARSLGEAAVMASAALGGLAAALLVGVRLPGHARVYGNALLLLAAAATNLARGRGGGGGGGVARYAAAGAATGVVKGVLGGGATPVLIAAQRLLGVGIDEAVFKTLAAEVVICSAVAAPYAASYGLHAWAAACMVPASAAGGVLGGLAGRRMGGRVRRAAASAAMACLALLAVAVGGGL